MAKLIVLRVNLKSLFYGGVSLINGIAHYVIAWASKLNNQVNFLIRAAVLYGSSTEHVFTYTG